MKDMFCRTDTGYTVVDKQKLTLIQTVANCLDTRTGEIVPLTFYYLKHSAPESINREFVRNLISLTVAGFGFQYVDLVSINTDTLSLDAERIWKEKHEQKALPY